MDGIWNDLRQASLSNVNLRRVCEQVAAEASALEERFGSVHGALRASHEECWERERAVSERLRRVEEMERESGIMLGKKEEELVKLEGRIKWCEEESVRKERELGIMLGKKEEELVKLEGRIKWCEEESVRKERELGIMLGKKEEELVKLEGRIKWCEEESVRKERELGIMLGKKEEELVKLEGRIKWCEEESMRKERELKDKGIELKSLRMSCEEVFEEYGRMRVGVEELRGRVVEAARRVRSEEERLKELKGGVDKEMERELAAAGAGGRGGAIGFRREAPGCEID